MTTIRNRIFANVLKERIKMRAYWIRVGPESMESVLKRDKKAHRRLRKKNKCRLSQRLELYCYKPRKQGRATGNYERQEQILP